MSFWSLWLSVSVSLSYTDIHKFMPINACAHIYTLRCLKQDCTPTPPLLELYYQFLLKFFLVSLIFSVIIVVHKQRVLGCHSGEAWFPVTEYISLSLWSSIQMMGCLQEDKQLREFSMNKEPNPLWKTLVQRVGSGRVFI